MKLKSRNKISPEFSMSSMTDVVFLLLVFFMLTSNVPNALDIALPQAKGKSTRKQQVVVTIDTNLRYFVNGQEINGDYLEIELRKALADQEEPTILLRAEENIAIKEAVKVMEIANQNKYKVILAVRPH